MSNVKLSETDFNIKNSIVGLSNSSSSSGGEEYLSGEQIVGTWIDGENLYGQIINAGKVNTTPRTITLDIENIKQFWVIDTIPSTTDKPKIGIYNDIEIRQTNINQFTIKSENDYDFMDIFIKIYYTKTTPPPSLQEISWVDYKNLGSSVTKWYNIGDEKTLTLTDNTTIDLQIAGFEVNKDQNNQWMNTTFITKNCMPSAVKFTTSTNSISLSSSIYKDILTPLYTDKFPDDLKSVITPAKVMYYKTYSSGYNVVDSPLYILNLINAGLYESDNENIKPYPIFTDNSSRIKTRDNTPIGWGLGSSYEINNTRYLNGVSSTGGETMFSSYESFNGVVFAFGI